MNCQILRLDTPTAEPRIEPIHTLDELEEIIKELGGSVQIMVYEQGWIIDDFRKGIKKQCCENCGWWDKEGGKEIGNQFASHGDCNRALGPQKNENQYRPGPDSRESPMVVQDGEDYVATLCTHRNHCCKEWREIQEPKPEEKQEPFVTMINRCTKQIKEQQETK